MDENCKVCGNELLTDRNVDPTHCRQRAPVDPTICLGCWIAIIELEKWLVRAMPDRAILGPWAESWLQEIMKDPKRLISGES